MDERVDADQLHREVTRYLEAVALFRALGHEPDWRGESPVADVSAVLAPGGSVGAC